MRNYLIKSTGIPSLWENRIFKDSIFDSIDRFFNEFGENRTKQKLKDWCKNGIEYPKVNVYKQNDTLFCEFFVPGVKKTQLEIEYDKESKILSLTYQDKEQLKQEDRESIYMENRIKTFSRSLSLESFNINLTENQGIGTRLEDGILLVTFPILEENKIEEQKRIKLQIE